MQQSFYDDLTWMPKIDKTDKPMYLAIMETLDSDIRNGVLKPGDKLPPQRELADFLHINLTTVTKAFKLCERKGLIYATVGKGTFISADANVSTVSQDDELDNGIIEMGTIRPLYSQNKLVVESIRQTVQNITIGKYLEYDEPKMKISHREIGSKWLKRFHIRVKPENIAIASGAQNALAVTMISLFQPGDKIGTDSLTYTGYKNLASTFGVRLVPVEMDKDGMNPTMLSKTCKNESLKGLYLIPECQNPTTCTMPISRRQEIAEIIKANNLILIEDDTYSFLENSELAPVSELIPEQSIYINCTSKSLSAGLRVAFMAVAPKFHDQISRGIYNINLNTSHFNVEIVANLIETGLADQILEAKRLEAETRNKLTDEILNGFTVQGNKRDYFRWLILPDGWAGKEFEYCAKVSGVQIYCAERFAVGSNPGPAAVRIATASVKNQNELIRGLTILKDLINKKPDVTPFIV